MSLCGLPVSLSVFRRGIDAVSLRIPFESALDSLQHFLVHPSRVGGGLHARRTILAVLGGVGGEGGGGGVGCGVWGCVEVEWGGVGVEVLDGVMKGR